MNNNQSLQNIKKEIKSMASLLIFQESLVEEIMTSRNMTVEISEDNKRLVAFH
jgi:hypothetical protein